MPSGCEIQIKVLILRFETSIETSIGMKIRDFVLMAALAAVVSSCGDPEFKVSGEIYGGVGKTLLLE